MKTFLCVIMVCFAMLGCLPGSLAAQTADPTPTATPSVEPTPAEEEEKLNLNFATLEDLQLLPGVTEEIAQAMIKGRPYQKIDDLLNIEGVTKEMLVNMQDVIEVRKLNLNDATLEELHMLPEITEEMAQAIFDHRPYKIIEEVLKIRGFGEARLNKIRERIDAQPARPRRTTRGWNIKRSGGPIRVDIQPVSKTPEATPTP